MKTNDGCRCLIRTILLSALLAVLLTALIMNLTIVTASPSPPTLLQEDTLIGLYDRLSPSVFYIRSGVGYEQALGTGWLWRDGLIVSCQHVIENREELKLYQADPDLEPWYIRDYEMAGQGRVALVQDDVGLPLQVIGEDAEMDVALLRVKSGWEQLSGLTPLVLGDSDQLKTGQFLISIGNSYGLFKTFNWGILTYRARTIPGVRQADVTDMLQHQSITHPGNSGGPVMDWQGRVVGMCQLGLTGSGIGLSIPSNKVDKLARQMFARWRAYGQVAPWAM